MELNKLTEIQEKILNDNSKNIIVKSVPGSGKTFLITEKIKNLISTGIKPEKILVLVYSKKACNDIISKLKFSDLNIFTFHSLGLNILKDNIRGIKNYCLLGYKNIPSLAENEEIYKLLYDQGIKNPETEYESINILKKTCSPPVENKRVQLFQKEMIKNNLIDYSDMIYLPVILLNNFIFLNEHYKLKYDYILVDEFQDINPVQFSLLQLIFDKQQSFFAVGDCKQAIYSWRGASAEYIKNPEKYLTGIKTFSMNKNYRSLKRIINTANLLVNDNKITPNEVTKSGEIYLNTFSNPEEEIKYICNKIIKLLKDGTEPHEIAILYRLNETGDHIETMLNELLKSIKIDIFRSRNNIYLKNLNLIINILKIICENNNTSMLKLIKSPLLDLNKEEIRIFDFIDKSSLINALPLLYESSKIAEYKKKTISENYSFRERLLFNKALKTYEILKTNLSKNSISKLKELYEIISGLIPASDSDILIKKLKKYIPESIITFIHNNINKGNLEYMLNELIILINDSHQPGNNKNSINLLSLHSSKGLEFQVVFIAGIEEGTIPLIPGNLEEEKNLFYVGITRAKKILFLSKTLKRKIKNKSTYRKQSRFLKNLNLKNQNRVSKLNIFTWLINIYKLNIIIIGIIFLLIIIFLLGGSSSF